MNAVVPSIGGDAPERLDLRGLRCPLPVLKAARRLAALSPGARLEIWTDDPLASIDLPNFCREHGQALVGHAAGPDGVFRCTVARGPLAPRLE